MLEQGEVHIKTIKENNGIVLGHRALRIDGIEPLLWVEPWGNGAWKIFKGYEFVRNCTPHEGRSLPGLGSWGYGVIKIAAEQHFGG